jgi:CheY-like chemotaxis protein
VIAQPTPATPVPPPEGPASGTILVVEDYADLRALFEEILRSAGYSVVTAPDGAAGLAAAHDQAGGIDLLLTDIVMPDMLGSDLARNLCGEYPGLRVIFMSGHAQPVLGGMVTLEPETPLLQKPFMEAELLSKVREVLAAPAQRQPAGGQQPAP